MNKIYYYNVGGLCFSANADMDHPALFNFCPFAVRKEEVKETIFSLGYIEQLPPIPEEMNAVCHVCDNGTCWNFYYSTCYTYCQDILYLLHVLFYKKKAAFPAALLFIIRFPAASYPLSPLFPHMPFYNVPAVLLRPCRNA